MKKVWLSMFVAVCFCCTLAAGTSQAGVAKVALTAAKKVSGLPTPPAPPPVKPLTGPVELSLTSLSSGGSGLDINGPVPPRSLVLDDGSRDNDIGIGGTLEFLFLNRFTPAAGAYPFVINEVQVYFSSIGLVNVGDNITLAIYENTSGNTDPAVGSNLLATFPATVQAVDAWSVYTLGTPVLFNGPGDALIGVIALEVPGTSYWPASIDQTVSQQRSWAGWWLTSPPPSPPTLPPDNSWSLIDAYFPGNWMIRGYGLAACIDKDGDGYGDNCTLGPDCNDNNSAIHPGATEVCNGIDDNCNGQTDEGVKATFYRDADNDTFGTPAETIQACTEPAGYVSDNSDCDDTDAFYTDICPTCTVKVIPKTLGWLVGDKEKTRSLLVIGKRGAEFDESTEIKWESNAIDVVRTRVFFKRFMFMRAKFNGEPLDKQEYRVLVGECEGTISWAK
jgi:hypothetical protein